MIITLTKTNSVAVDGVPQRDIPIRAHTAVMGTISEVTEDAIVIRIDGHEAIMGKKHMVKGEKYVPGRSLQFYVLKRTGKGEVYVSRNTQSLPEALLRMHIPAGHFRAIKRHSGVKSIIEATVHVPKEIIESVERDLGGEKVFLRRPKHGGRQFKKYADSVLPVSHDIRFGARS